MRNEPKDDINFYKTSRFDVIFIGVILALSIFYIVWIGLRQPASKSATALIYLKDGLLEEVDLRKDRMIPLLSGRMQIEVKGEKIRVAKSECPHHICVNMGWLRYSGQTIACVPNKVLIEIKSAGPAIVDAVAY